MKTKLLLLLLAQWMFLGCTEEGQRQNKLSDHNEMVIAAIPVSIEQDSLFLRLNDLMNQNLESHRHLDLDFLQSPTFIQCLKEKYDMADVSGTLADIGFNVLEGFLSDCGVNDDEAIEWVISSLDMMQTYHNLLIKYPELELHGDSVLTAISKKMNFPMPNPQNY